MRLLGLSFLWLVSSISLATGSPSCEIKISGKNFNLNQEASLEKIADVFSFLSEFEISKPTVQNLETMLKDSSLKLAPLSEANRIHWKNKTPAALYDVVDGEPTIFLENSELGILAVRLFHEAIHATDEEYAERTEKWRQEKAASMKELETFDFLNGDLAAWERGAKKRAFSRQRMVFDAERKGHNAEHLLIEDIVKRFEKCAADYYSHQKAHKQLIVSRLSDKKLIEIYELDLLSR